jgi:uncharacterized membrane-anchored protein YjiN (DUF445 family)
MEPMAAHGKEYEAAQRRALGKMKVIAASMLIAMAAIFIVSKCLEKAHPFLAIIAAFSEAAMVGALADWFAVTALFRHPLDIPIPHTAIIPRNKERFGNNLARFIRDNFLSREAVDQKLRTIDFAEWIAQTLSDETNAKMIAERFSTYLQAVAKKIDDNKLKAFVSETFQDNMKRIRILPFLGGVLESFTEENRHQEVLNEVLAIIGKVLEENKAKIQERMHRENPWWMPDFVDDVIFNRIIGKVEEILDNIRNDRKHEIRNSFNNTVQRFIDNMKESESFSLRAEQMKNEFFGNQKVKKHFQNLWNEIKGKIINGLKTPGSQIRKQIEAGIVAFGRNLTNNNYLRERLNTWLHDSILNLTNRYSDSIITIISDTVRKWDADKTSRRIELYIGKDLQWIRINGTLVGGLVGLLIYFFSLAFKS